MITASPSLLRSARSRGSCSRRGTFRSERTHPRARHRSAGIRARRASRTRPSAPSRGRPRTPRRSPASGARTQGIRRGVFSFKNAAGDALGAAHIGGDAYVHDDQTFGATSNTGARVKGGTFVGLDPDISGNVLVQVG
jgi:hypothetical protein